MKPMGPEGVRELGHREYVGGLWEEMGQLQFDFLLARGLLPAHYLCDIACGSLRAGRHFIRYLDPGHYLGIDKEQVLIDAGVDKELGEDLYRLKRPQFVVSAEFAFAEFAARPNYALAQSLFTHLPTRLIEQCLRRLRAWIEPDGLFYATFFEVAREADIPNGENSNEPHDHAAFYYTQVQMADMGKRCGWQMAYIGPWGHPRRQMMLEFVPG
jgi:SAM-dependent methyltransferase